MCVETSCLGEPGGMLSHIQFIQCLTRGPVRAAGDMCFGGPLLSPPTLALELVRGSDHDFADSCQPLNCRRTG